MTIVYMAEISEDYSDTCDLLEEAGYDVMRAEIILEVLEIADEFGDVVVLFEQSFAAMAPELKQRFLTIERKPTVDASELLDEVKKAVMSVSTQTGLSQ